jgi:hypothetical protein
MHMLSLDFILWIGLTISDFQPYLFGFLQFLFLRTNISFHWTISDTPIFFLLNQSPIAKF